MTVKHYFLPHGDHQLLAEFDLSQIEIAVLAYQTQDTNMIQDIKDGVDFHLKRLAYQSSHSYETLLHLYKAGDSEVAKRRKLVKEVSFQRSYGAGWRKICETTGLTEAEVKKLIEVEEALYPDVVKYQEALVALVNNSHKTAFKDKTMTIRNMKKNIHFGGYCGHGNKQYHFAEYPSKNYRGEDVTFYSKPQIYNYIIQGTAADIIKIFLVEVHKKIRNNTRIVMVNTVHDSILFSCENITAVKDLGSLLNSILYRWNHIWRSYFPDSMPFNVPLRGEIHYGENWGSLDKSL